MRWTGRCLQLLAIVELIGLFALAHAMAGTVPSVTEYPVPNNSPPYYIASDPADGALWFTTNTEVGRITTSGNFTEYPAIGFPVGIALGPDGALWFAEASGNGVGRFTTTGNSNYFQVPTPNANVFEIATGPDGAMWATEFEAGRIARITTSGVVTEFSTPTRASHPFSIVAGPDGALWFTEQREGNIGRITTDGVVTEFAIPTTNSRPSGLTGLFGSWLNKALDASPPVG